MFFLKTESPPACYVLSIFSWEVGKLYFPYVNIYLYNTCFPDKVSYPAIIIDISIWLDGHVTWHAVFKLTKLVKQHQGYQGSEVDVTQPIRFWCQMLCLDMEYIYIYEQVAACCLIMYSSFMFLEHLFGTLYWSLKIQSAAFINTLSSTPFFTSRLWCATWQSWQTNHTINRSQKRDGFLLKFSARVSMPVRNYLGYLVSWLGLITYLYRVWN